MTKLTDKEKAVWNTDIKSKAPGDILLIMVREMETLAWAIPAANVHTPKFISLGLRMRMFVMAMDNIKPVGTTPKGTPMPQTPDERKYLFTVYEKGMIEADAENSRLRSLINDMAAKLEKQRRTIKFMRETGGEK